MPDRRRRVRKSATSADGTVIAYQQQGSGPALILVDGALSTRDGKAGLRALLAPALLSIPGMPLALIRQDQNEWQIEWQTMPVR